MSDGHIIVSLSLFKLIFYSLWFFHECLNRLQSTWSIDFAWKFVYKDGIIYYENLSTEIHCQGWQIIRPTHYRLQAQMENFRLKYSIIALIRPPIIRKIAIFRILYTKFSNLNGSETHIYIQIAPFNSKSLFIL